MKMEGPEHLSPALAASCASWLFGEWFWKGHPLLILQGELPRGAVPKLSEVVSASQLAAPVSLPKARQGEPVFWDTVFPAGPMSPLGGQLHAAPQPPQPFIRCVSCTHPRAAHSSTRCLCSCIEGQGWGGYTNTASQCLYIDLLMESRGSEGAGREGSWHIDVSWCCHHIPPASSHGDRTSSSFGLVTLLIPPETRRGFPLLPIFKHAFK